MQGFEMEPIELQKLTDRELLIVAIRKLNAVSTACIAHNRRIESLEHWRAYLTGAFALLSLIMLLLGNYVLGKL